MFGAQFYSSPTNSTERTPIASPLSQYNHIETPNRSESSGVNSISLHQKLDLLLTSSADQTRHIEKLQKENEQLTKDLQSMKENVEQLRSDSIFQRSSSQRTAIAVPPAVSSTVRLLHNTFSEEEVFDGKLSYTHERNQTTKSKLLSELQLKYGSDYSDRILNRAVYRYYESRRRVHNDSQASRLAKVNENRSKSRRRQSQRNLFKRRSKYIKPSEQLKWQQLSYQYMSEESGGEDITRHPLPWRSQELNKLLRRLDKRCQKRQKHGNLLKPRKTGSNSLLVAPESAPEWAIRQEQ